MNCPSAKACSSEKKCSSGNNISADEHLADERSTVANDPAPTCPKASQKSNGISRRTLIRTGAGAVAAATAVPLVQRLLPKVPVFIAKNQRYDQGLEETIRRGLLATGIDRAWLQGKRVLLKPNLVEPNRDIPHMTTHPNVILAAAEVFRSLGAAEIRVGEGPGHVRDTEAALYVSGVADALESTDLPFADLNYEEVAWNPNRGGKSKLDGFFFPRSVCEADLIVSLPKMKTHHWVGVTASMKNLYGIIPGIKYGWPKNVLHHNGIPETVIDINASAPRTIGIVDGIECMEGDGPILGSMKRMGLILVGQNLPALDATLTRIMGLRPERIPYLRIASQLGPIADYRIQMTGENWHELVDPFQILDRPHLRDLRASAHGPLVT